MDEFPYPSFVKLGEMSDVENEYRYPEAYGIASSVFGVIQTMIDSNFRTDAEKIAEIQWNLDTFINKDRKRQEVDISSCDKCTEDVMRCYGRDQRGCRATGWIHVKTKSHYCK